MVLSDLKDVVDRAIESAKDYGARPEEIVVSLQIEGLEGACVHSSSEVELHYDNDCQASGCVLTAWVERFSH